MQGTFALSGGTPYATARAWGFDQTSPALLARPAPVLNAGGTGFSYTVPALSATSIELSTSNPLPVSLVEFTGQAQADGGTLLRWRTATEANTAAFEVQRSSDGRAFRTLLRVPATNTATAHTYSARDAAPAGGASELLTYYRLRVLDKDGSTAFSPVLVVARPAGVAPVLTLAARPNKGPAGTALQLAVQNTGPAQPALLHLTDALGRVVLSRPVVLPTGALSLPLPEAAAWPCGLYLLTLRGVYGAATRQKLSLE